MQLIIPLILLSLGHFFIDAMIGIWPLFKTEAGIDIAVAGFISSICVVLGEGMQVKFGHLADKGYSALLIAMGIVLSIASALLPYSSGYFFFGLCLLFTFLGSSAFHPTAAGLVAHCASKGATHMAIALFHTSGLLGLATSQLLFSSTAPFSAAPKTVLLAVPGGIIALLCILQRKKLQLISTTTRHVSMRKIVAEFFKHPQLCLLYFALLCNQIVVWSTIFLLPDFVRLCSDSAWVVDGGGHLVYVLGAACAAVPLGYLADKFQPRKIIFIVSVLGSIAYYLLVGPFILGETNLFLLLFLVGGLLGAVTPLSLSLGNSLAPGRKGAVSAFLMGMVWIFSEGLGISTAGFLSTLWSENGVLYALQIMGLFSIASAGLAWILLNDVSTSVPRADELLNHDVYNNAS